jgi:hypothetical protein
MRRNRTILFIGCGLSAVVCVVLSVIMYFAGNSILNNAIGGPNLNTAAMDAAKAFMSDLAVKNYDKAYNDLDSSWQKDVGSGAGLKAAIVAQGGEIASYNLDGWPSGNVDIAVATGTASVNGQTLYIHVTVVKQAGVWKVNGYKATDSAPTPLPTT